MTAADTELDALHALALALGLGRAGGPREGIAAALRALHESGRALNGALGLCDDGTGDLVFADFHDPAGRHRPPVRYRRGEGVVGLVLERGVPVVVERVADEPRFLGRLGIQDPWLPFVGVPLFADGKIIGVLATQPAADGTPPRARVRFLETAAALIVAAVRASVPPAGTESDPPALASPTAAAAGIRSGFERIVGRTRAMRTVFERVRLVAKWNTTVLILGESGTGKELVARAIHHNSPRQGGPLVTLNCAALPDTLLESELFGHEKGAFTGAVAQRKGRFEQAHGGTLFLDEIGEITPAFQAKLLRVLQYGEFERVGGMRTLSVDVRIIAATNRVLETEVAGGRFREDLYYRLNVMPIHLPALRERTEDIPELARGLVERIGQKQGRRLAIADAAVTMLLDHSWPGNVRELENHLERCAVLCDGNLIGPETVTRAAEGRPRSARPPAGVEPPPPPAPRAAPSRDGNDDERERVTAALREAGWVQAKAARLLGMTPRQIAYRIKILDIPLRQI